MKIKIFENVDGDLICDIEKSHNAAILLMSATSLHIDNTQYIVVDKCIGFDPIESVENYEIQITVEEA